MSYSIYFIYGQLKYYGLRKDDFNIEDIIDHSIVYILNTMEISWRSSASPQTSNLEKKEVKYTEIDDLAYH